MRKISELLDALAQEHQPVIDAEKKCALTKRGNEIARRKFKKAACKHFITAFQSELARLENEK